MKRKRRGHMLFCILAGLVLAGCTLTEGFEYSGTASSTEVMPLGGVEVVEFRLGSEDVEVVSKEDTDATFIIKKAWKANDKEYGQKLLDEVEITIERDGDRLVIKREGSKVRDGWDMITKGYVSIDITVTIPADVRLDIATGSGDIDLDDRTAPVKVSTGSGDVVAAQMGAGFEMDTGSGDIHLRSVNGLFKFSSGSGDIRVDEVYGRVETSSGSGDVDIDLVRGDVKVSTGSGDVGLGTLEGNLHARTSSGDVTVHDHKGEADIGTSSGDVELRSNSGTGILNIDTSSGDVDVVVFDVDSVEVDLRTSNGVIRTRLPLVVEDASRRRLLGRAGRGDLKIDVSTTSGDISVRQGSI
jgi:DUF4097 and DUF4098 domain-containing protein YvlB